MALLITTPSHATPGLTILSSKGDSTTGQYKTQIEDIKVKVQGGYVRIEISRGRDLRDPHEI